MTDDKMPLPRAWMTNESAARLALGGNCKWAVPVHSTKSATAKNPLFTPFQMHAYARQYAAARAAPLVEALERLLDMDVAYQRGPAVQIAVDAARAALASFKETMK